MSSLGPWPDACVALRASRCKRPNARRRRHELTDAWSGSIWASRPRTRCGSSTVRANDRETQGVADGGEPDRGRDGGVGRDAGGNAVGGGDRADRTGVVADRGVLHQTVAMSCIGSARPRRRTCAGSCRGTPRPTASTPTRWPGCRCSTLPGCSRWSCPAPSGRVGSAGPGHATGSTRSVADTRSGSRTWSAS